MIYTPKFTVKSQNDVRTLSDVWLTVGATPASHVVRDPTAGLEEVLHGDLHPTSQFDLMKLEMVIQNQYLRR